MPGQSWQDDERRREVDDVDSNVTLLTMPTPALSGRQAHLLVATARACVAPTLTLKGTGVPFAGSSIALVGAPTRTRTPLSADLLTPPRGAPV